MEQVVRSRGYQNYKNMNTDNNYGYHTHEIQKGILGEFSKVEEEFEELKDAYNQTDPIMILCECSDLIGAIKHYVNQQFNIELDDLIKFNNKTEQAFKIGKR